MRTRVFRVETSHLICYFMPHKGVVISWQVVLKWYVSFRCHDQPVVQVVVRISMICDTADCKCCRQTLVGPGFEISGSKCCKQNVII